MNTLNNWKSKIKEVNIQNKLTTMMKKGPENGNPYP
jgi:hypothetical protein